MGYFAPPSDENWRIADVSSRQGLLQIDWMRPNDLATTWQMMAKSVIAERRRQDAPDLMEAISVGLLPDWNDADDLLRAILAYRTVIRLDESADIRRAGIHFELGILHRTLGERLHDAPEKAETHASLAQNEFVQAEQIYTKFDALAGRIETAVAKADTIRLLAPGNELRRASDAYNQAWSLLTQPGGQTAVGVQRFETLAKHVVDCMKQVDAKQFGTSSPAESSGRNALAVFLRPLEMTRKVELQPPPSQEGEATDAVSLEIALTRALAPEVALTYIGGALHPQAASMVATSSEKADWQLAVKLQIQGRNLVILVPGYTPGMQWELRYLTEERLLARTLLVMLPVTADAEAAGRWERTRTGTLHFGLDLPKYRESGGFFRIENDNTVIRDLPFEALWKPGELLHAIGDLIEPQ